MVLLCGVITAIHIVNMLLGYSLSKFGIIPRSIASLPFILSAPFLHGSVSHLLNNLTIFSVLSFLCLLNGERYFFQKSVFIVIITGLLVWLFARSANHIGASGWVFGLWGYLIARAYFQRKFKNIIIALGVVLFYGGMVFGVLPSNSFISWESHFFGVIAGTAVAWLSK